VAAVGGGGSRQAARPSGSNTPTILSEVDDCHVGTPLVVVDTLGSHDKAPALLVYSVAELARRASFDVSMVAGADISLTLDELERTAAGVVLMPICRAPIGAGSPANSLSAWEKPATLCRELTKRGVPVIAVMVGTPAVLLAACMAEGALGVIGGDDLNRLLRQLRDHVANRAKTTGTELLRRVVEQPTLPPRLHSLFTLTSAERRVLIAMMQGWPASYIASSLVVSLSTVRSHIRSILNKLNVSTQIAAVAIGYGTDPGEIPPGLGTS
jgi:DNA-binding NarL/FixJ family response regulator